MTAQAIEEPLEHALRVLVCGRACGDFAARQDELRHLRLHVGIVAPQRRHEHWLDEAQDRGPVGVVGAELGALRGVQAALEEGAEDGRLDLAPVEVRDLPHGLDLWRCQRQDGRVLEEPAVEPLDALNPEVPTALRHLPEEVGELRGERVGLAPCGVGEPLEEAFRQQPHVLREHDENEPVQEVRHRAGFVAPGMERCGEGGEPLRRLRRQLLAHLGGTQRLGVGEHRAQDAQRLFGVGGKVSQGEAVDRGRSAREVRVHLEAIEVAHDEERRVLQRLPVVGAVFLDEIDDVFEEARLACALGHGPRRLGRRRQGCWRVAAGRDLPRPRRVSVASLVAEGARTRKATGIWVGIELRIAGL